MHQRRSFTPQFKTRVVLDVLTKLKSVAQVCRDYDLKEQVVVLESRVSGAGAGPLRQPSAAGWRPSPHRRTGALGWPDNAGAGDRKKSLVVLGLSRDQKRQVIPMLAQEYPISLVCPVLALSRSTLYYQPVLRDEPELRLAVEAVAQAFPTYGSQRLTQQVRRAPYRVVAGRTRVRRLMGELGFRRRPTPRFCRTTNSQHSFGCYPNLVADLIATVPDAIWVSEIV